MQVGKCFSHNWENGACVQPQTIQTVAQTVRQRIKSRTTERVNLRTRSSVESAIEFAPYWPFDFHSVSLSSHMKLKTTGNRLFSFPVVEQNDIIVSRSVRSWHPEDDSLSLELGKLNDQRSGSRTPGMSQVLVCGLNSSTVAAVCYKL